MPQAGFGGTGYSEVLDFAVEQMFKNRLERRSR
jgi:hypothetical protein